MSTTIEGVTIFGVSRKVFTLLVGTQPAHEAARKLRNENYHIFTLIHIFRFSFKSPTVFLTLCIKITEGVLENFIPFACNVKIKLYISCFLSFLVLVLDTSKMILLIFCHSLVRACVNNTGAPTQTLGSFV